MSGSKPSFVLNDESRTNSYGFRIANAGLNRNRFDANPVLLFDHRTNSVIGRWENLRIEGSKLIADADFDMNDPEAAKIAAKVENGYLKGCSIGMIINDVHYVNDGNGNRYLVVSDWELLEASIVAIPSNAAAIKLYNKEMKEMKVEDMMQLAAQHQNSFSDNTKKCMMKKQITLTATMLALLLLDETATEQEICNAIERLNKERNDALNELSVLKEQRAEALAAEAVKHGKITELGKATLKEMAVKDYEAAKKFVAQLSSRQPLSASIARTQAGNREDWDFGKWRKEDPEGLEKMRLQEPERYEQLRTDYAAKLKK
ncbi:MAG: HK97 family phage prohead protease [Chitinophagaceae bacterium]|nr:HK97 family phage prohead protease [Chitinophagaceae bacterium]